TRGHSHRARKAWLHRGESSSDRQVKEAKTKCRTIASLLTEAPDPHSRGVLMFKKRRRRARHYTLVSFGEGDDTDGGVDTDAGLDTDAAPYTSESDLDEDSAFTDLEQEMEAERARVAAASAVAQLGTIDGLTGRGAEMFKERQRPMMQAPPAHQVHPSAGNPGVGNGATAFQQMTVNSSSVASVPQTSMAQEMMSSSVKVDSFQQEQQQHRQQVVIKTKQVANVVNRTARPFTPAGPIENRAATPFAAQPAPKMTAQFNQPVFANNPSLGTGDPPAYQPVTSQSAFAGSTIIVPPPPPYAQPAGFASTQQHSQVEQLSSREQRISIPASRSGILAEAKKRNQGNKAMFTFKEPPKNSPNPDLLSLVQNLDDKTKPEGQFEVGPEEDSLGLGAEASNFWQTQAQAQGFKSPPPVAPKPMAKVQGYEAYTQLANQAPSWSHQAQAGTRSDPIPTYRASDTVSNDLPQQPQQQQQIKATLAQPTAEGARFVYSPENNAVAARNKAAQSAAAVLASDMSQMKGKGAQLFAKRQSRMEKYIVDGTLSPAEEMRGPSPTPSLPSSWKYSSQIRAPPPIGFNPILSPFYPLAAAKGHATQSSPKSPAAAKTKGKPKPKMESLDVMKHQPYQLNSAMFSFSPSIPAAAPAGGPGRQAQSLPRNAQPPTAAQASEATRSHLAAQNQAPAMVTTQLQMELPPLPAEPPQVSLGRPVTQATLLVATPRPSFSAKKNGAQAQVWR
uniref:Synaptopodin 2 n=1 Tax=Petromyzon marinus TaxID=7757 RepID=S4RSW5_PETMA